MKPRSNASTSTATHSRRKLVSPVFTVFDDELLPDELPLPLSVLSSIFIHSCHGSFFDAEECASAQVSDDFVVQLG